MIFSFWNKKIPTLAGLIIIIAGLSITTLLVNKTTLWQTGAQASSQPQDVRITNISDSSFTVSYRTDSYTSGYINYGLNNSLEQIAFDEKDISQKLQNHYIHSITVKNLDQTKKYYFSIISGNETYINNGSNFEISTTKTIPNTTLNEKVIGKVILPNSNPPDETIVYLSADNSQVLSTIAQPDGSFVINTERLLNSSLNNLLTLKKTTTLKLLFLGKNQISNAVIYYSQAKNIPIVTLTNNYDFRVNNIQISTSSAAIKGFPILNKTTSTNKKNVNILIPQKNQIFSDLKPTISGQAMPNETVEISINSANNIKASVIADDNGNWSYQPDINLDPGNHTISISTKDSTGNIQNITQSFSIDPSTNLQSNSATNSVKTAVKKTNIIAPNDSKPPLPTAGNISIITAGIVGLLITIVGGVIFLLSRKSI